MLSYEFDTSRVNIWPTETPISTTSLDNLRVKSIHQFANRRLEYKIVMSNKVRNGQPSKFPNKSSARIAIPSFSSTPQYPCIHNDTKLRKRIEIFWCVIYGKGKAASFQSVFLNFPNSAKKIRISSFLNHSTVLYRLHHQDNTILHFLLYSAISSVSSNNHISKVIWNYFLHIRAFVSQMKPLLISRILFKCDYRLMQHIYLLIIFCYLAYWLYEKARLRPFIQIDFGVPSDLPFAIIN